MRGYFGIGIENAKTKTNIGTLWRSANIFGAAFIFTVGKRYKEQKSDTPKTTRHLPLLHYSTIEDMHDHLPHDSTLVGIEMHERASPLSLTTHPERAVYLLGAEDYGLTPEAVDLCSQLIYLPGGRSMNVSVAGSIVMYDRVAE